jgi:hypothetical protein
MPFPACPNLIKSNILAFYINKKYLDYPLPGLYLALGVMGSKTHD